MEKQIDARGKACPTPVIMAKKESDQGNREFSVLVDNTAAVENLKRFGGSNGYRVAVSETGGDFQIDFLKSQDTRETRPDTGETSSDTGETSPTSGDKTCAVFVGREGIGDGDPELGKTLMKMYFYTLAQGKEAPRYILFMNGGVKVPAMDEQAAEHLQKLQEMGAQILVCGTCLNFYGIADQLKAGQISNMYDIAEAMSKADKVISL